MKKTTAIGRYFEQFRKDLKYKHLLGQLVSKGIKTKYRRSFLGIIWSLLNPLLDMIVMAFVFSSILGRVQFFQIYLLTGTLIFNFHREATTSAQKSIQSHAGLLKKNYAPMGLFPLSSALSALVHLGFSLIALVLVVGYYIIVEGFIIGPQVLMMFVMFPPLFMFCLGVGYILAALDVFFKDVEYLYGIILHLWRYLTPIFYTIDKLPQAVQSVMQFNPMYHFIGYFRDIVMYQTMPSLMTNLICYGFGFGFLIVGYIFFSLLKNKFVTHL